MPVDRIGKTNTFEVITIYMRQRGSIKISAVGASMYPWIRQGDICTFVPLSSPRDVQVGDIILYTSGADKFIAHRIYRTNEDQGETTYVCKGDSNQGYDPPVKHSHVLGKLIQIQKRSFHFAMQSVMARTWTFIIMRFKTPARIIRWHLGK